MPGPPSGRIKQHIRDVCLWQASLDIDTKSLDRLSGLLSDQETARSRRFLSGIHRRRYVAAHGILRCILGQILQADPVKLVFKEDEHNKPCLETTPFFSPIYFNMSHSRDIMLAGVSRKWPIGVDVEYMNPSRDVLKLAPRFFHPAEIRDIKAFRPEHSIKRFYQYWTLKEAYLKATGEGISRLGDVEIRFDGNNGRKCKVFDQGVAMDKKWTIVPVSVRPGYVGAMAAGSKGAVVGVKTSIFE